jgi:hypothetical protein
MNFKWKEAVWLALDDCGEYPDTQCVYVNVLKYKELSEHQRERNNQNVHLRYQDTVRNVLNGFRTGIGTGRPIIEGSKETRATKQLKYGCYGWVGIFASKDDRKIIRNAIEQGSNLEQAIWEITMDLYICTQDGQEIRVPRGSPIPKCPHDSSHEVEKIIIIREW